MYIHVCICIYCMGVFPMWATLQYHTPPNYTHGVSSFQRVLIRGCSTVIILARTLAESQHGLCAYMYLCVAGVCDLPVNIRNPLCKNGATCINTGVFEYYCQCPIGFKGRQCESLVNYGEYIHIICTCVHVLYMINKQISRHLRNI